MTPVPFSGNFARGRSRALLSLLAIGVAAAGAAYSRQGGAGGGRGDDSHVVHVHVKSADETTRSTTPAGPVAAMIGHVVIVSDDTTMSSDKATYNEKTGVANSPGAIKIEDPQNTITGNTGTAYYARRDALITGNVHITVRPKPTDAKAPEGSARREFKNPVNIDCDDARYNWRTRIAVVTGHLTLKETDRTVTADKGTYYGKDERVVLDGHVHFTRTNGDHGDTTTATAILTEGHESFKTGPLTGEYTVQPDDSDTPPDATTPTPAPGKTTPPARPGKTPAAPNSAPSGTPAANPANPANPTTPANPANPLSPPANPVTPPVTPPISTGGAGQ